MILKAFNVLIPKSLLTFLTIAPTSIDDSYFIIAVCYFQSMNSPMELNSLLLKLFCYITWFDETNSGGSPNETNLSKPIISFFKKMA